MPWRDPAARAAANRRWREANRFRTATSARAKAQRRQYGGTLSTADVRHALEQPCSYCGEHISEHVEHCTPLSRGGENEGHNIVGACSECNTLKARRTVLEFFGMWPTEVPF